MTVENTENKEIYSGNGTTYRWPITFETSGVEASEIKVYRTDSDGVSTLLTSNYEVDLNALEVIYPTPASGLDPVPTGEGVVILRALSLNQELDLKNQGTLNAENLEDGFDRVVMMIQQVQEQVDRTPQADVSESGEDSAVAALLEEVRDARDDAEDSANAAAASANSAATSATNASASATAADTSKTAAQAAQVAAEAAAATVSGLQRKIVVFTIDMTTASGLQAVSGTTFTPKLAIFFAAETTASMLNSWGFDDGTSRVCIYNRGNQSGAGNNRFASTVSILADQSASANYQGYVDSFNSTGCIINWTKSGAATGTLTIAALFLG